MWLSKLSLAASSASASFLPELLSFHPLSTTQSDNVTQRTLLGLYFQSEGTGARRSRLLCWFVCLFFFRAMQSDSTVHPQQHRSSQSSLNMLAQRHACSFPARIQEFTRQRTCRSRCRHLSRLVTASAAAAAQAPQPVSWSFQFVGYGEQAPQGSICCDGLVSGVQSRHTSACCQKPVRMMLLIDVDM